ncbi:MAG: helix-turn-helix domain-containing protein [Oscillospiraceae bacterium]
MNLEIYQERRRELKLTYDELVKITGLSKRMVSGFFSGDPKYQNPSVATLEAINRALGFADDVPINAPTTPSQPRANEVLTEKQKRLLAAFDALIPSLQDYIIETTEKLVVQVAKSNASDKRA